MVYRDLTARSFSSLHVAAIGLILACNPDKGDDTSASDSAATTGNESSGGATTDATTGATTDATTDATTGPTTGPTTGATTDATTGATTTTGSTTTTEETTGGETTGGAVGCAEDPEFTASWNAWQTAVQANGATYYYSVIRGTSGFGPPDYCLYRTTIVVTDGAVVERRFEISQMVGDPVDCEEAFTEMGENVGTQVSNFAAVPVTVETLYGACCDDVIHIEPAEEYMVTFEADDQGLMKQCYYVANGCADGCDGGPLGPTLDFEALAFGAPPAP